MKNIKYIIVIVLVVLTVNTYAQSHDKTYQRIRKPKVEAHSVSFLDALDDEIKNEMINYNDQLGRTIQVVAKQASPKMKDVVKFYEYDKAGRVPIDYLGYVDNEDNGHYKNQFITKQSDFYKYQTGIAHTERPYRKAIYETSPLSRVVEAGAEGWVWQPENGAEQGHTTKRLYLLNAANTVLNFGVNETNGNLEFNNSKYYSSNKLYYTETTDENDKISGAYTNQAGQSIAKVSYGEGSNPDLITYYVYDNLGRLCYVITPELSAIIKNMSSINMSWSDNRIKNLSYAFKYDDKNRIAKKLVSGADEVYFVYDGYNRVIMQQDGNLRNSNKWKFIKYDALSRPVMMGIKYISNSLTQESAQQTVDTYYNSHDVNFEYLNINRTGTVHEYTNKAHPVCSSADVLVVNYYDDYSFDQYGDYEYAAHGGIEPLLKPKGFLTGTKVKIMESGNNWLYNAYYYDSKYRIIQSYEQNIMDGYDRVYYDYTFDGTLVQNTHDHMIHEGSPDEDLRTETRTYSTDHAGRILNMDYLFENIDVEMYANNYNELGRLIEKDVHNESTDGSVEALQSIDYKYNIRGWLTNINDYLLASNNNNILDEERDGPLEEVTAVVIDSLTFYVYPGNNVPGMPESVGILLTDLKYLEISKIENPEDNRLEDAGESQIIWVYEDEVDSLTYASLENYISSTFVFDMSGVSFTSSTDKETIAVEVADAVEQNMISLGFQDTLLINLISDVTINYYYHQSSLIYFAEGEGDIFGMDILYNEGFSALNGNAQYNGLISGIKWRSRQDGGIRGYGFAYDEHYRFTDANYGDRQSGFDIWDQNGHYDVNNITYDLNSNIETLDRMGVTGYSNNEPLYGNIDDLSYTYYNQTNQLKKVSDQSTYLTQPKKDFDDRVTLSIEYTYDDNGNLKKDLNKNITNITYNYLNKPEEIVFSDGKSLTFLYDALGRKLKFSVHSIITLLNETSYASNYVYKNGNLEYVLTEEGRLVPDGVDQFKPEYYFRDHLGNVRVIYAEDTDGDAEILEEHHYYPFGMTFADLDYYNTPKNPYLYQSKPFIDDYDLNWHDFDARMFDSQLGRWHVIDPVMQFASPYIGMGNNPVSLVDPQGTFVPYPDGDEVIINSIDDSGHNTEIDATLPFEIVISGSSGGYSVPTTGYWGYGSSGGGGLQNYSGDNSSGSGGVSHGGGNGSGGASANSQPGAGNDNVYSGKEPVPPPTTEELIEKTKTEISTMLLSTVSGIGVSGEIAFPVQIPFLDEYGVGFDIGIILDENGLGIYSTTKTAEGPGVALSLSVETWDATATILNPKGVNRETIENNGLEVSLGIYSRGRDDINDYRTGQSLYIINTYSYGPGILIQGVIWETHTMTWP